MSKSRSPVAQRKKPVKKSRKKKVKKISFRTQLKKGLGGLLVLIVLVIIAGVMVHHFIKRQPPASPAGPMAKARIAIPVPPKPVVQKPRYEVYPHPKVIDKPAAVPVVRPRPDKLPKVAIIIDDIGYDRGMARKFLSMDAVLTFSI